MTSLSDGEILRRVQSGERNLYVQLFDRYYGEVERYARSRSRETASRLASDTFQWAYRSVGSFQPGEMSYLAHLLTICRKLILLEEDRPDVIVCRDVASPSGAGEREEQPKRLTREALNGLSAEDRELIYLAYEPALSRQEIMMILGEPSPDSLTVRLCRAMQRLNAAVNRSTPDEDVEPIPR